MEPLRLRPVDLSLLRDRATAHCVRSNIRNPRVRALEHCDEVGEITSDAGLDIDRIRHGGVVSPFHTPTGNTTRWSASLVSIGCLVATAR